MAYLVNYTSQMWWKERRNNLRTGHHVPRSFIAFVITRKYNMTWLINSSNEQLIGCTASLYQSRWRKDCPELCSSHHCALIGKNSVKTLKISSRSACYWTIAVAPSVNVHCRATPLVTEQAPGGARGRAEGAAAGASCVKMHVSAAAEHAGEIKRLSGKVTLPFSRGCSYFPLV